MLNFDGMIVERSKSTSDWWNVDVPFIQYLAPDVGTLLEDFCDISYLIIENDPILKDPTKIINDYRLTDKLFNYRK
jgi:hypothetical protein